MACYNLHITGRYNPLYTANSKGLGYCSTILYNPSIIRMVIIRGYAL